jgi:glucan phosphoethanolaminetransferase (alkaline phosphatase superfamily)
LASTNFEKPLASVLSYSLLYVVFIVTAIILITLLIVKRKVLKKWLKIVLWTITVFVLTVILFFTFLIFAFGSNSKLRTAHSYLNENEQAVDIYVQTPWQMEVL